MSKKIHTINSYDKNNFDSQVNELLEFGGDFMENSYQVNNTKNGIIYSQVIIFTNNCELEVYGNGKLKSVQNKRKKIGWYENGKKEFEYFFKNNKINGLATRWYENGQRESETMLKDDIRYGLRTTWYENGQKRCEGNNKNDDSTGKWTFWYPNGQKQCVNYREEGKLTGLHKEWYEAGQKKEEGNYKIVRTSYGPIKGNMSHKDGLWTGWFENGQKRYEGNYKIVKTVDAEMDIKGLADGLWFKWYETGEKKSEVKFKDGNLIYEKHWNLDGSVGGNFSIRDLFN